MTEDVARCVAEPHDVTTRVGARRVRSRGGA